MIKGFVEVEISDHEGIFKSPKNITEKIAGCFKSIHPKRRYLQKKIQIKPQEQLLMKLPEKVIDAKKSSKTAVVIGDGFILFIENGCF